MPSTPAASRSRRKKGEVDTLLHNPMMETLLAEHRHMGTMLKMLEKQLDLIENDGNVDPHVLYETMYYMTQYPDRFHHPREDVIFQRAAQLSSQLADDVDSMQRDHDRMASSGVAALQAIVDWREGNCEAGKVVEDGREYIADLFRHMEVEEKLVFPLIEATLSHSDWAQLSEDDSLLPAPDPVFGAKVDREFRNVARTARRALRRGVENAVMSEWLGIETAMESVEVLSMARDHSLLSTREHARATLDECREIISEGAISSPFKCAICTTRQCGSWLWDQFEISRDTLADMGTVADRLRAEIRILRSS